MKHVPMTSRIWAFILYFFVPGVLLILLSLFLIFFVLNKGESFSVLQNVHHEKVLSSPSFSPLLKNQKIKGSIKVTDNNLGSIALPFNTYGRINSDLIQFNLKEAGKKEWYYTQVYESKKFGGYEYFPFGFPVIKDSSNKNYYFEIVSINGKPGNAVAIENKSPQVITRYLFSKEYLLNNPAAIIPYLSKKIMSTLNTPSAIILFSTINSIFLLFYFVLIKFIHKKIIKVVLVRKNKTFNLISFLQRNKYLFLILSLGMLIRIALSTNENYNFDMTNFIIDAEIFRSGKTNIYLHQGSYNYSPALFFIIGFVDIIQRILSFIPFYILFRVFISFFDLASALILYRIAKIKKMSPLKTVCLFFLNPVSIILSGFHAQFDNIAIFFLLIALLVFINNPVLSKSKSILIWVLVTVGFVIKHIIFPQTFLFYTYLFNSKRFIKSVILFTISVAIFFITFIPFYAEAADTINKNVFQYSGLVNLTGFTFIISELCKGCKIFDAEIYDIYKYIFIIASFLFAYFISRLPILRSMLLVTLFFLTFSSSIASQYLILPVAFGAFFPTKWFYMYSAIVTAYLLGNSSELNITAFGLVTISTVWIFALLWFISELLIARNILKEKFLFFNKNKARSKK